MWHHLENENETYGKMLSREFPDMGFSVHATLLHFHLCALKSQLKTQIWEHLGRFWENPKGDCPQTKSCGINHLLTTAHLLSGADDGDASYLMSLS